MTIWEYMVNLLERLQKAKGRSRILPSLPGNDVLFPL
jgi:hypothetical protein